MDTAGFLFAGSRWKITDLDLYNKLDKWLKGEIYSDVISSQQNSDLYWQIVIEQARYLPDIFKLYFRTILRETKNQFHIILYKYETGISTYTRKNLTSSSKSAQQAVCRLLREGAGKQLKASLQFYRELTATTHIIYTN